MNVKSTLAYYVNTFGQEMLGRYGERVHKIAIDATFTCPNRDGTKGRGGCSFWCGKKWKVLNGTRNELWRRVTYQGVYHALENSCVV